MTPQQLINEAGALLDRLRDYCEATQSRRAFVTWKRARFRYDRRVYRARHTDQTD